MSLFDAAVDLNPHQIEAALFALQNPLSKGVILADEVGLGKTIEAGIVLCQFWAERNRRLLVLCPASIRKQWALELEEYLEDGGQRKFILVEMGDYFDTVLVPRLKKFTFTPEWKDGKPKRLATPEEVERSPRIMKVVRLESYEDVLNNLENLKTPDDLWKVCLIEEDFHRLMFKMEGA